MAYNSTIRAKQGICPMCPGTNKQPLIGGMCQRHYWDSRKMKSAQKAQEKELEQDEDLQTLVADLDIIFSRYIRLKDAEISATGKIMIAAILYHAVICTPVSVKAIAAPSAGHVIRPKMATLQNSPGIWKMTILVL